MVDAPDKDVLSNEIAVSAELTPTGVTAKAKSRTISALDRLGGNLIQLLNNPVERKVDRDRARAAAETSLIEAWGEHDARQVTKQTTFAATALEQHARLMVERETNKAAVATLALEHLSATPPSDRENAEGPERLNEDFINRFARYAEDATSEQVRERWASVLAREVRKPGTFSLKVLRLIDELDPDVAEIFERLCRSRVGIALPTCLVGDIPFDEEKRLVASGLIIGKGVAGQVLKSQTVVDSSGSELTWFPIATERALGLVAGMDVVKHSAGQVFVAQKDYIGIRVYALTDEGHSIASILPDTEIEAVDHLAQAMSDLLPAVEVRVFQGGGPDWTLLRTLVQTPTQDKPVLESEN